MSAATKVKVLATALCISLSGLLFIEQREGGYAYEAYPDAGHGWKVATICAGHTKGVKKGDVATEDQCDEYLRQDTEVAQRAVRRCVKVPITQAQFDVLTSFDMNTGALCVSQLAKKLNAGQCLAAAKEFNAVPQIDKYGKPVMYKGKPVMKFTSSNGKPMRGLESRRQAEREKFEKDC